ncbi:DUF2076 domain-containing protein [Telmatospirillum sp. J64-1]|uniref:DUF2076 domain-containing protein n=1 Tax=Telmatospirillum sp. J64-1 TaxID=2502183 RepID=UPI00115F6996|nr:DUF2076 domain-containing protein [Telmatospirillum sp. J64-1]
MNQTERDVIEDLFGKLRTVETQAPDRDAEAEQVIREKVASQPSAPYYMAQTILVQEHALKAANERVAELEHELAKRPAGGGGGFLASLFGGGQPAGGQARPAHVPPPRQSAAAAPFQNAPRGSFLGGAMQTALGVAGGVLMGNAIMSMFSGNEAQAAEPAPLDQDTAVDYGADESYYSDGDFGADDNF